MATRIQRGSWLVTVPLAGVAVLYMMFFFLPGSRAIGEIEQQIEQKQDYITQAAALAACLETSQQELEKTRAYTNRWEEHAPSQRELSRLFGRINALAKAAGTTTTRFDPEPIVQLDSLHRIPLSLGCKGSFAQIYEFLRSLDALPVSMWIDDLQIQKREKAGASVECELVLVVFADNPDNSDYVKQSE